MLLFSMQHLSTIFFCNSTETVKDISNNGSVILNWFVIFWYKLQREEKYIQTKK